MDLPEIRVGTVLYGFCGGHFGRDSYENKTVEAFGCGWLVARDSDGGIHVATSSRDWKVPDCLRPYTVPEDEQRR
jgi:hypothetical protein